MNNVKKIGLTALAASLVSFSANAGELTISGAASIGINGYSGEKVNMGKSFTMGNQFTVSGGGELDNGMNVSLKFQLDNGDSVDPFDDHSITISSDEMGSLTVAGHGGNSAATSIDKTVAGDLWDGFDGSAFTGSGVSGTAFSTSSPGNNSVFYTLPSIMDGVEVFASYNPSEAGVNESELGYGITYTGIEGLKASYATTDIEGGTTATSGDQTSWKATYAFGPITVGASSSDHDVGAAASDRELDSYNISYTITDELSVAYGIEELSSGASAAVNDAEFSVIQADYTSGGMTITAKLEEGENVDNTNSSAADQEYYFLGAAFAF